jgi:hypothetical protein
VGIAFDYLIGDEDADELAALQELVDNGSAWRLEGSVGRAAMAAIEAGQIALGPVGHRDYWGNYVPSRDEVEPGTKGSVEFVEAHGGRVPS